MAGIIKNIPVETFGIHGNRGHGFPIMGHLVESIESPFQTSRDCALEKEQDGFILTTENGNDILIVCGTIVNEQEASKLDCYVASDDTLIEQVLQQEGEAIIVQCD